MSGAVEIESAGARRTVVAGESAQADGGAIQTAPPSPAFRRAVAQIASVPGPPPAAAGNRVPALARGER